MPRSDGCSYSEHLTVRLPRAVVEAVARRASETGQSRAEVVRATLADRLIDGRGESVAA